MSDLRCSSQGSREESHGVPRHPVQPPGGDAAPAVLDVGPEYDHHTQHAQHQPQHVGQLEPADGKV